MDIILNILRTIREKDDALKIIDYIASNGLLEKFSDYISGINDFGGKSNYSNFVKHLLRLYRLAYEDKLINSYSSDAFGNVVSLSGESIQAGRITFSKFPLYFDWIKEGGINLLNVKNIISITSLKSLGNCSDNRAFIDAFDIVVVKFTRDIFFVDSKVTGKDRIMAMPAFVLQWLCRKELKKEIANKTEMTISIASFVTSFSSLCFITRSVGVSSTLWGYQKGFAVIMAAKDMVGVIINTDKCQKGLNNSSTGKTFLKAFEKLDISGDLAWESGVKALLKQEVIDAVGVIAASWQLIKLDSNNRQYFDDDERKKVDNFILELQKAVNIKYEIY